MDARDIKRIGLATCEVLWNPKTHSQRLEAQRPSEVNKNSLAMPPGRPDRAEQTHVRTINQLPLAPNDKQSNSTPHTTAAASDNTEHHQHSIDVGTTSVQHDQTTLLLLPREADAVELSIIRIDLEINAARRRKTSYLFQTQALHGKPTNLHMVQRRACDSWNT
uniref:Uncharacterized protein n=1 Tax=Physcomitrium patens TaxID=3218 RepID=A0A7I4B790_PHYPA